MGKGKNKDKGNIGRDDDRRIEWKKRIDEMTCGITVSGKGVRMREYEWENERKRVKE